MQANCFTMTYRLNNYIRGDKLEDFITTPQLLVSDNNKMKPTDKLLKQVLLNVKMQ